MAIKENRFVWIIILTLWAIISDFFDGFLARKFNQISNTGKVLDPLADKLCFAAGALALALYNDLPISLLVLILMRDAVIALFGITIIKRIKIVPVSNIFGKLAVFILSLTMLVYILHLRDYYKIAYILSVIFILASSLSYLLVGLKLFRNKS